MILRLRYCSSEDVEEVALSNRGKVWSYTIVYEGYGNLVGLTPPYAAAFVELPEGAYVHSLIVGCNPEEVKVGMNGESDFLDIGKQQVVYVFKPVSG
ncbi:MAG: hypothetical protein COW22_04110 [Chloroflexi bacterium CG15_BIG_FIL_POST_REV_8_21_14_020_46_15]|nr:MAG: hypothetical protein COW22_04110 [Chloroflexi bacterium CG15_BIG_FIL_POST_REV_8_21_14_020_46_15]